MEYKRGVVCLVKKSNDLIKSKERVKKHGEVYTPKHIVKQMCDAIQEATDNVEKTILEPLCDNVNFLIELLERKLKAVKEKYCGKFGYDQNTILAVATLYGVDLLKDNIEESKERMLEVWKKYGNLELLDSVRFILDCNIICGNFLTRKVVDENNVLVKYFFQFFKNIFGGRA